MGASLVGVVVVLVILGALAALAVTALPRDPGASSRDRGLVPDTDVTSSGAVPSRPRSLADTSSGTACLVTARTLETAWATKNAADGTRAATVAELVETRYLTVAPAHRGHDFTFEAVEGRPTGKVLVNGSPSDQGCLGAPRPGS